MPEKDNKSKDMIQKLQQLLRAREERIVALETENAMLYLKLAQCQGNVRSTRKETTHVRRLYDDNEKFKSNIGKQLVKLCRDVKDLRLDAHHLKIDTEKASERFKMEVDLIREEASNSIMMMKSMDTKKLTDTEELQHRLSQAELALDEAMRAAHSERTRRKTLHNTLMELRGNIRVHCRVRPMLAELDSAGDPDLLGLPNTPSEEVVTAQDDENVIVSSSTKEGATQKVRLFEFERVYNPSDSQNAVFTDVAPLLTSLLDGYNVCIMAYGQTGSGKTHTMLSSHSAESDLDGDHLGADEGVIPRSARELFRLIKERENANESWYLEISVCEIYLGYIKDLLAPPDKRDINHSVFMAVDGSQEIPSLVTKTVTSVQEVMTFVHYGLRRRHEDATKVHAHSSRSHLIVQLNLYHTTQSASSARVTSPDSLITRPPSPPVTPTQGRRLLPQLSVDGAVKKRSKSPSPSSTSRQSRSTLPSSSSRSRSPSPQSSTSSSDQSIRSTPACVTVKTKLQLVDLAGSECVGMTGVTGAGLRESSEINKSLSALADVLQALAEHRSHIPYRNTKLTHMLQDTIGGDAKLLVMLCVSPVKKYLTETAQCLGFGSRARQVARGQAKKRRPTGPVLLGPSDLAAVNASFRSKHGGSTGNLSPRRPLSAHK
eukprot:gene444-1085_t